MKLRMELSGGLELLFGNIKVHNVDFPVPGDRQQAVMSEFLLWTRDNLLKERPELFMKGTTVRPGILVLINECDWELSGELSAQLVEGDTVVFISTLHGG